MAEAIEAMGSAFAELSSGRAVVPQRLTMEMPPQNSRSLVMPVYSSAAKQYAVKVVTLAGNNPARNLPFIHGLLMVFDSDTGVPLAILDAEYTTALRTGAASGLATDLLARRDANIAMVFGAGTQARTQLEGVAAVRHLERAMVFSPDRTAVARFCELMKSKLGFDVDPADSPSKVAEADIVCTATTSEAPVFRDEDLKPGTHINGIGSYKPSMREIPSRTVKRSKLVVDSRTSALAEAGDLTMAIKEGEITNDHIYAELGELVLGAKEARTNAAEITVFKSVGNAAQDLAVASRILDKSMHTDIGTVIAI